MADSINPNANKGKGINFLPKYYQSDTNKKFLQATVDQLVQPGTVNKINGYVGRENAKASTGDDIFVAAASADRQNYQLEPGVVVNDESNRNTFFKDYQDYINQLSVFGGNTTNHSRVNKQEFYSWDPHIDWDKFVNFQNYYWLPFGPDVIAIKGQQENIDSAYRITVEPQGDNNAYIFWPNGLTRNPTIKLYRGQTYTFEINSVGNPFSIKTQRSVGPFDRYQDVGVSASAVEVGTITLTIPYDAPDVLYYQSEFDIDLGGVFQILSIDNNTSINVETEILGKQSFKLPDGTALSNGMKVRFLGNVTPASYATGRYYVEGVGESIKLIDETILELVSPYTTSQAILFDNVPFDSMPFSDATAFAGTRDYVVINRSSLDHNPWSRYNRWFHKDAIEASAIYNGKIASLDQSARAVRPIIEFEANLKLFNFGRVAIPDVDLVDTYTTDVFSNIEGQLGYNIDGIDLAQNQRILFTADTDSFVKNKIYKVNFVVIQGIRQIHLELVSEPVDGNVVLVKQGQVNQGHMFWFNGSTWQKGQQKDTLNQPPLFDVFDEAGNSYSDIAAFAGSSFAGTKIFSYKVGSGTVDSNLGFALSYKNISNIGDIVFNFNLANDSFLYKELTDVITQSVNVGYLKKTTDINNFSYVNGWQQSAVDNPQAAVRIYKNTNQVNNFELDIFDDKDNLKDLNVKVYVNGIRLDSSKWSIVDGTVYKTIVLDTDITVSDVLTIRAFTSQAINSNGYYEVPVNLQNNPLNNNIGDFTLGEVIDHVGSIVDNLSTFSGTYPGVGNLRDLGNTTKFGTKFIQHSGPASLSLYHVTSEVNNIVRAIEKSRDDYNKFKRNFIVVAETLGIDGDPIDLVDIILQKINKDKPKNHPYYFSDMVPYGASIKTEITVVDPRIKAYPLSAVFSLDVLSNKSVHVYLTHGGVQTQLLALREYTFDSQGFVVIANQVELAEDDVVTIYEYENTNGCFVPQTPTKLGIWPKYTPKIYLDTSLITPRTMIQGHDGSQTLAYGDYRDDLILELEKRIYNNIKVKYDPEIFDIYDIVPRYNTVTDYSRAEFDQVLAPSFYKWTSLVDRDFTKPLSYDRDNSLTYHYGNSYAPDGRNVPGYWRGVYRWLLGTDRPNMCPWEMLGFTEEPLWWQDSYGPAPYTSNNLPMWEDIASGTIKEPGKPPVVVKKFKRDYLLGRLPVDSQGNIISPLASGLTSDITIPSSGSFVFGDVSPVEAAWRRSSYYPFSVLLTAMLLKPASTFGTLLDRSRIVRNLAGQLVYSTTNLRIRPADIVLPSIYSSTTNVQTAGIINYLVDYILSDNLKSYNTYLYDLDNLDVRLSYRVGGFTSKEKFNLLLDSKTPLSQGSVFVPQEDYDIILNSSSPVKKITYSGVIITKLADGYEVKGYSKTQPYFKYYAWTRAGVRINVGGISESYSVWTPNSQYAAGKIVLNSGIFYRVKVLHTATSVFDIQYYQELSSLPIIGGRDAMLRRAWDRTESIVVPYGTKFTTIQDVVDFLLGYGEYLKDQGFIFDDFNNTLNAVTNWETSAKEFLFWTTQNWSTGEDKWEDWLPDNATAYGAIVRYNGDYYRAVRNSEANPIFIEEDFVKLDGLSTVGSSVISLSPAAIKITFSAPLCVVDDIRNQFNGYEIFAVDGKPIEPNFLNSYREDNAITYTPQGDQGIYGASFYLVQKEQVIILNNSTLFNDTIYNLESGYRQERIKVAGYVSTNWYGGFDVPGFIFDQAKINDWEAWQDYSLGDIVKYKEFYFSAATSLIGSASFDATNWIKLDSTPTARLLPNWSYKAGQFEDFYSLDSDNFDVDQQKLAQHLIGYQKRQYLSNIIQDDVSEFKFYQGMIVEKGTQNVLNKLFDVLSADGQESLKFYEEWALREGQYGASASFENIEFTLDEAEFKNNPQGFELVDVVDSSKLDFIIRQTPNDVYLKPVGYKNNPWPTVKNYVSYLRTPGYVRPDEVAVTVGYIDELTKHDISKFKSGDYVWVGFEGREWNVYRYTNSKLKVTNVVYDDVAKEMTFTTNAPVAMSVGTMVGISQVSTFAGFYKVVSVDLNKFTVAADGVVVPDPFTEQGSIVVFKLTSQRAPSMDTAQAYLPAVLTPGELLWTDDAGNGKWATWKYNPVFVGTELINTAPQENLAYGRQVVVNNAGTISVVSTILGELVVYDKASPSSPWIQRQTIVPPFITFVPFDPEAPNTLTGDVMALSDDSQWLATGTPLADYVTSFYKGAWFSLTEYTLGQIVSYNGSYYELILVPPTYNYPPSTNPTYWKKIPYIPVNEDATDMPSPANYHEQGVITLYKKDANNIFTFVDTIISPFPTDLEHFGASLVFGNNTLFVGAPGRNSNTGRVYKLEYSPEVAKVTSYNPTGSSGTIVKVTSTSDIEIGMTISGTGFTSGQTVIDILDSTTLVASAVPDGEVSGQLSFTITEWRYVPGTGLSASVTAGDQFGSVLSMSKDSSTLLVTANALANVGKVFVYKLTNNEYVLSQTIVGTDKKFGISTTSSNTGDYIAISSVLADSTEIDQGTVIVYNYNGTAYVQYQELTNSRPEPAELFGSKISFMNDSKTLVVYSRNADNSIPFELSDNTIFDNNTTTFYQSKNTNGGRVDIYDRYSNTWVYSESLVTDSIATDSYGTALAVGSNHIFVSAPYAVDQGFRSGKVFEYSKLNNSYSWNIIHSEIDKPDLGKIKQAFLYNKETNKLITYLDVIDSNQGHIPGIADQEIKFKTFYDPAVYSVGDSSVNVDDGMAWTTAQVGMLWWDLRTAKFYNSYDDDIVYRNSTWNSLFPNASIDVYEWIETSYLPSEWDQLADTEEGLTKNISGTSLYGDTSYSVVRRYDNVSKSFKNTYYYWVKNKSIVPGVPGRNMSSQDVAELISNPRGQGYKYLALTGTNSFSLVNVKPSLQSTNVVLSVEYWTVDDITSNVHTQWKLINNNASTTLPSAIEQKWFDSLCGKDSQGRTVPDTTLPIKLRYGVENRPRQSMFVNRFEALKQLIEQVNAVLINEQISEQADLSLLTSYEAEPSIIAGLYDTVVDTDAELRFAGVGTFTKPVLNPVIVDGKITGVDIVTKGSGYLVAPFVTVSGSGKDAKIKTVINSYGQITGVEILNSGYGYDDDTSLFVRNYSVLVHSDSASSGNWSIYSYEPTTLTWSRLYSQSYDTRSYWSYVDWYATGYNQFTASDFAVNSLAEITSLIVEINQLVKVLTNNNGNWMLLRKYADSSSVDWTQSYEVVGLQNGTIQFSSSLYSFANTSYGYDGSLYDGSIFDNSASTELRNILTALKDNILIDTLRQEYLNLFFTCIRYALSEQNYLDWIFKTSFVKAQHNVGELAQHVTYRNDNLEDFEAYISEVKPYRTKIREYVSNYSKVDTNQVTATDFDLPVAYTDGKLMPIEVNVINDVIEANNTALLSYPWKHWLDNVGFTVTELRIVSGGSGYVSEPVVRFTSNSGSGASARAFISNGKVNRVVLITKGDNYLSAPTVVLDGGILETGTPAKVVAIIGDGVIRSNLIKMKFDRITQSYFITQLQHTETFTGTGSRLQFPLQWAPDLRIGKSTVLISGVNALRDNYKLAITKSTSRGYTSYAGSITFDTAPAVGASISVTYLKDWSLLNAADRIQYYYNPATGELGKDLAQLMTGIDYGGVIVNGLGFDVSSGWDSVPYFSDKWGSFDETFDDYIITVGADTRTFTLPYVPEADTEINVYQSTLDTVTYTSNGTDLTYRFNVYDIFPPTITVTRDVLTDVPSTVGEYVLNVESTVGVKVGDFISITPFVSNTIGYNTKVTEIINSTSVRLDQILFKEVPSGSTVTFERTLVVPTDCTVAANGIVTLTSPVAAGSDITIRAFLSPVRLDQSLIISPANGIADGETDTFVIDPSVVVGNGDQFILRKSTSDGSIKPQETDYDTSLSGGEFLGNYNSGMFTSATGLAADDIILDGDGFVTPTSSPAPEEVVPGQVVDAVAIKVYDRPTTGTAGIKVDSYIADGISNTFNISQQPNSPQAVIVKTTTGVRDPDTDVLSSLGVIKTVDEDYTVDYRNRQVVFNEIPPAGELISIYSIGYNGSNILDLDYFIADGETLEFVTKAPWVSSVSFTCYVDGKLLSTGTPQIFKTDSTYESSNRVGIRFGAAPEAGALISFIIVSSTEQTFAITKTERIATNGDTTYELMNVIGDALPIESNMIVRVDQTILKAPTNSYFVIKGNKFNYTIDPAKFLPYSVSIEDIVVLANGQLLKPGFDYNVDLSGITVKLNKSTAQEYAGSTLILSIRQDAGYLYVPPTVDHGPQIVFSEAYDDTRLVEVISSYKHDILDIQRTAVNITNNLTITPDTPEYYNYVGLSGGYLQLDRTVIDDNYVWVLKNGKLLTPSADFKLNSDKQSITLALLPDLTDEFTLITFGSNVLTSGIAYMQFKDMLNRTHFKRLSANKQTVLVRDLKQTDVTIEVADASNFDLPSPANNKPGIVEIRGERIEYFNITSTEVDGVTTYLLGQLRRGTLGTGTPSIHKAGSYVQDIGASETMPYTESLVVENVISNGTSVVDLDFVPGGFNTSWKYKGQSMTADTVTSLANDAVEVFAAGVRLKKNPYKLYSVSVAPESPEGDVDFSEEFTVDGTTPQVTLATPALLGTTVTVVKRVGQAWDGDVNIQNDTNKIARFLKATPGIWYTNFKKQDADAGVSTWDNTAGTFDSTGTTFDRG